MTRRDEFGPVGRGAAKQENQDNGVVGNIGHAPRAGCVQSTTCGGANCVAAGETAGRMTSMKTQQAGDELARMRRRLRHQKRIMGRMRRLKLFLVVVTIRLLVEMRR